MASEDITLLTIRNLQIEALREGAWNPIVHGVDLDLKRGEVLGLIGESGAGKSTIGLAVMGFARNGCRISGGSIKFDGIELVGKSEAQLRKLRGRKIAYVAQCAAASFNPMHRLIDQHTEAPLTHGLMTKAEARKEAVALYERMRLPDAGAIGFRYPHQISGGQLQRAMTAMAMACKPDLIIFDEPTTALDVTTQINVLAVIRDAVRNFNTAAIYITHDLAVVAQMADRIKVLLKGREVEEADTRTMLSAPKKEYTRSLWSVRDMQAAEKPAASNSELPLLQVDNVEAYYRTVKVLNAISFNLHKGRTLALVGESGSGKSTTARMVVGLMQRRSGDVRLAGESLPAGYKDRSRKQLQQIQMIYQNADTALNPRQPIGEIIGRSVAFYLGLKGRARDERVKELLMQMELEPKIYFNRLPPEISGGQKQRIGIARALAAEPEIIICDEVISSLDQLVAEGILKLLQRVQQERNMSYLFITHDLSAVRAIADECVVMQRGCIVEQGPVRKLLENPQHAYTQKLLDSVPQMAPDWLTLRLQAAGSLEPVY